MQVSVEMSARTSCCLTCNNACMTTTCLQIQRHLSNLLVAMTTHSMRGRCISDSFTEATSLFRRHGIALADMPFTLDQIRTNLDKGRYRRLDRFQDDIFALLSRVRELTPVASGVHADSIDLQKFFISKRDELKDVLISPASAYTESSLRDEIDASARAAKREALQQQKNGDNEPQTEGDEKADNETKQEAGGEQQLDEVEYEGIVYRPNDFVYVASSDDNAAADSPRHILRIERIIRDDDHDDVLVRGLWVFRPSETYHLANRKFYEKVSDMKAAFGMLTIECS